MRPTHRLRAAEQGKDVEVPRYDTEYVVSVRGIRRGGRAHLTWAEDWDTSGPEQAICGAALDAITHRSGELACFSCEQIAQRVDRLTGEED